MLQVLLQMALAMPVMLGILAVAVLPLLPIVLIGNRGNYGTALLVCGSGFLYCVSCLAPAVYLNRAVPGYAVFFMTVSSIFWWSNPLCWTAGVLLLFGKGKRCANWSFGCAALAFALGCAAGFVDGIRCGAGYFIWLSSLLLLAAAGVVAIRFADDAPVDGDFHTIDVRDTVADLNCLTLVMSRR